ncbi:MAG TPA: MFS transporter [Roseiflexaceae bacterium]|nr:MFS transporter [Roseiflexaceae bacterium]
MQATQPRRLGRDFWLFWSGQTVSNLGTSVTQFALPLLTFQLTGSAFNLALTMTATFLPYLLFGLVIGAWVDRLNRKRLMISVDILQALVIGSVPLAATFGFLSVWWLYGVGFLTSTLAIAFQAAEFAAIPSLVDQSDLVTANGRIQASYSAAMVIGPLLAGMLLGLAPLADLMLVDSISFALSAVALAAVRSSFNGAARERSTKLRQDIAEGLRYVLGHPVLRSISLMMALVNLFGSTIGAQLVLFAKQQLQAGDSQVGLLYSAGSAGVILLSLLAGPLRKRWSFSRVALGALMLSGVVELALSTTTHFWVAVLLWALTSGLGILFNINTSSLRQAIVPNEMLGRVMSIAGVLAWSAIPLGTFVGGLVIERTGNVSLVFAAISVATILIPLLFSQTALGRAEAYVAPAEPAPVASS